MIGGLITVGPGTYRLRVHARGRDTAFELTPDGSASTRSGR
ncbi:hypothetical protein [Streptomyces uncialis]|nr:hypothetical protein [Streptomyces uncialis]